MLASKLLYRGAEVSAKDEKGRCPLYIAAQRGNVGIAQLLLDVGASALQKDLNGKTPLCVAIETNNDTLSELFIKSIDAEE